MPLLPEFAVDVLPTIVKDYVRTGKVKLVLFAINILGPNSDNGLRAAYAAGLQDKLWNFSDLLFKSQGAENSGWITDDLLRRTGNSIPGFDTDKMLSDPVLARGRLRARGRLAAGLERPRRRDADLLRRPDGRHVPAGADRSRSRPTPSAPPSTRSPDEAAGVTDRHLRMAIAVLALAGAAVSAYLVYSRYSGTRLVCTTGGCETVQHSKYAKVAGIPVAVLGLVAYLTVFATALSARIEAAAIGVAVVLGGLAFGIYLIVIQVAVIDAICQWCLASDVILALLAVVSAERLRRLAARPQGASGPPPMAAPG